MAHTGIFKSDDSILFKDERMDDLNEVYIDLLEIFEKYVMAFVKCFSNIKYIIS